MSDDQGCLPTGETSLSAALRYAQLGYPVFPCVPGEKIPLTPHGFKDATKDPVVIEKWWTTHPRANIGLATAGLLVIDVDGAENPWPHDAERVVELTRAPTSITPHGGRHHCFRQPNGKAWRNTTSKIAPKVDTRANGGYIVVSPSVVDGKSYRWANTVKLDVGSDQLPEPPDWVITLLDGSNGLLVNDNENRTAQNEGVTSPLDGVPIPSGQRNATLTSLAGSMRHRGMSRDEILAALVKVNLDRCMPPLNSDEVERIASSISHYPPGPVGPVTPAVSIEEEVPSETPTPQIVELPGELFHIPGFISEVMDYCLATAPYPNPVMAFSGALALQAVLAGRKVCDPGDNRTNLYLLGLAHSAAGKDRPRKVNTEILYKVGISNCVGGRFASGEGVQDALCDNPAMLFQTDEIDGMLQSINKAKDARHENIMSTLLTMYSSANSVFPMRSKAGMKSKAIDQPCLVILGTAIPNHYYAALSERMLTNGFFARMIILESGKRPPGQEPRILPLPIKVLETAKWWSLFCPGTGNEENWHPVPLTVNQTDEARSILTETRLEAEAEYAKAESAGDSVGTTVWGRVSENVRKLALLYAVSENHQLPNIGKMAVDWARRLVFHQTRRMLFMAQAHVADSPFHADCLKFLQKLRESTERELAHSVLLKRMKIDAKNFGALVTTLQERGDILVRTKSTLGRPVTYYTLTKKAEGA